MSQKNREGGPAGLAPVVTEPGKVRNVAVVGRAGVGKTTLVKALLEATNAIDPAGAAYDATPDHDPAGDTQHRSVAVSCTPLGHAGTKINLLDTPGHPDFVGVLRAGLRAADAALFVVSAVNGLDAATQQLWEECAAAEMPRAVAITRLDHPRADFDETLALCQRMFGDGVLAAYLPLHDDDGENVNGLIGLITERVFDYSSQHPPVVSQPAPEHVSAIEEARGELIEGIIAESEDETLMDRYVSGEDIEPDALIDDLETAVARGGFHPVIPVNATSQVGLDAVLEVINGGFPPPSQCPVPPVTGVDGEPAEPLTCDRQGRLVAEVIKTTVDSYVGRVSLVRVFSGTLNADTAIHISGHGLADRGHPDHDADERIAHVYTPFGTALREVNQCVAGDICVITKSGTAETGDTISAKATPLLMSPWTMPEPMLPIAITAVNRTDEDAMAKNLTRLVAADPTLRLEQNVETGQTLMWCMGESHAEVVLDRLRTGGARIDTEPVRIALRETFTASANGTGKHVKQSGGHGQYGVCHISVDPLEQGGGFEFVNKIVGGVIPQQFIQSVETGVRAQMEHGISAGYPVIDIRVTIEDGKTHPVDSSDAAFQSAGALALRDAAANGRLRLLEPIDHVAIRIAGGYVGAVMSDLSSRRSRVLGTETDELDRMVVRAEVPAAELLRYAIELRSITAGSGTFARTFMRYEPMPRHLAQQWGKEAADHK